MFEAMEGFELCDGDCMMGLGGSERGGAADESRYALIYTG